MLAVEVLKGLCLFQPAHAGPHGFGERQEVIHMAARG